MKRLRYDVFVLALLLALVLSAFNTAPAFADEATPPADETTSEEVVSNEETDTEEVVEETEATTPEEEAVTPPADEETESASESDSPSVAEIIVSLPENTELIVLDQEGEALPLASEAAEEAVHNGDPLWCPAGVAPKPGIGGCSPSFTSFNDDGGLDTGLIAWLLANQASVAKAGVIWVESNYAPIGGEGAPIVINGANFAVAGASMDDFALTINGGWAGCVPTCVSTLNPNAPSEFNVPFSIINWTGAITINNIVVTGATGAGSYAVAVTTSSNVTVNNMDVQGNSTEYGGALINNSAGVGTVVVNDSVFNENTGTNGYGLVVYSNGTVTGKNLSAMGNTQAGVYIDNSTATTPKAVTLNGTNHFNYNGSDGLTIYSKGAITLSNATAMGNTGGSGAYLVNNFSSTVYSAVTIKGTNNFSNNGWDGLRVYTYGAITISNITANDNGSDPNRDEATLIDADPDPDFYLYDAYGKGAYLENWSSSPKPVTLTGTNIFNGNASNGLYLDSNGVVKINNLTANYNGCDSLKDLDDYGCAGAYVTGAGVTITGYNFFIGNSNQGLEVYNAYVPSKSSSVGAITLSNLYAEANGEAGVWAVNFGNYNIAITGTNVFNDNLNGNGLFVWSNGVVTISNITANGNDRNGVLVRNFQAAIPKAVVITGTNTFNGNGIDGLSVDSYGAITTNNVTAMYNVGGGVVLDNCDWDEFDVDADSNFDECLAYSPQSVTMNGNNNTSENGSFGTFIESRGAITVNNITSNSNVGVSLYLWNAYSNSVGAITQKGYATLLNNQTFSGLNAFSNGAITMSNLTSSGNATYGAVIGNVTYPVGGNVILTGTNIFNNNGSGGLYLYNLGTVLLSNITANYNGTAGGVYINNTDATVAKAVTLNGNNTFNGNAGTGLSIQSNGAIKVNNVMANNNVGASSSGAELYNNYTVENQPITITGYGIFNGNGFEGLAAFSNGSITLANLTANNNTNRGVDIYTEYNNLTNTTYANVTLTGVSTFNENGAEGLIVYADGNITVSNITANNNFFTGAVLNNDLYANPGTTGIRTVTVSGVNMFNGNDYGLQIFSNGVVTLTRITANSNNDGLGDGDGLIVVTEGAINLTCGSMYNNIDYGYNLTAGIGKVVTIKGVFTYGNLLNDFSGPTTVRTRTCPLP